MIEYKQSNMLCKIFVYSEIEKGIAFEKRRYWGHYNSIHITHNIITI